MSTTTGKKPTKSKDKGKAPQNTSVAEDYESLSSEGLGSDVDEKGLTRLIAALGDDGLDDIAQHMLESLNDDGDNGEEEEADSKEVKAATLAGNGKDVNKDDSKGEGESDEDSREESSVGEDDNESASEAPGDDEDAVDLDGVSSIDEDVVPRQKIIIDNKDALERIREGFKLDPTLPWTETLSTTCPFTHNVDVSNDLDRELSFYKQALHSAEEARHLAASHDFPFTRPPDYFAEMVKSDAHMERIRQRLLDESASIKKSEEKRRERAGKKFGKQVQMEKVREREKSKKDFDDKIKSLKRKRKGSALETTQEEEDFEVAVEDAVKDRPTKRPRMPRAKRDEKYGRGGRGSVGWRSKQNTRESTDQFEFGGRGRGQGGRGRGGRGGKGNRGTVSRGTKRLGKSRRMAARGR